MRECTSPPRERTRARCARVARSRDDGWDGRARGGEAFGRIGDARACIFCLSFPSIARVVEGVMRVDGDGRRAIARAGWVGVGKPYPFIRDGERRFSSAFGRVEGGGGTRA